MDSRDADELLAYAGRLWRFIAKWTPDVQDVFLDGLRKIPITFAQGRQQLNDLLRREEKTPTIAKINRSLWSLAPTQQTQSPKAIAPRGTLMDFPTYVDRIAKGIEPMPASDGAGVLAYALKVYRETGTAPRMAKCMKACGFNAPMMPNA